MSSTRGRGCLTKPNKSSTNFHHKTPTNSLTKLLTRFNQNGTSFHRVDLPLLQNWSSLVTLTLSTQTPPLFSTTKTIHPKVTSVAMFRGGHVCHRCVAAAPAMSLMLKVELDASGKSTKRLRLVRTDLSSTVSMSYMCKTQKKHQAKIYQIVHIVWLQSSNNPSPSCHFLIPKSFIPSLFRSSGTDRERRQGSRGTFSPKR